MRFRKGDYFGELQILRDSKSPFDFRADGAVELLTFDEAASAQGPGMCIGFGTAFRTSLSLKVLHQELFQPLLNAF